MTLTTLSADLIRSISDPEHPHTLEQLSVVSEPQIAVQHGRRPNVTIEFTPTIPHCSMATLIGPSMATVLCALCVNLACSRLMWSRRALG